MSIAASLRRIAPALLACALAAGCEFGAREVDDEKNKWYILGTSAERSLDFKGAVEFYDKALHTNPNSAAAHKRLGWLHEKKLRDYATAIYHYNKLLKIRPDDEHADMIRDSIVNCKQELASDAAPIPLNAAMLKLVEENDRHKKEILQLQGEIERLRGQLARNGGGGPALPSLTNSNGVGGAALLANNRSTSIERPEPRREPNPPRPEQPRPVRPTRHTVAANENMYRIALRYGLTVQQLQAANPNVNPSTMRIGATLRIPPAR